MIPNNSWIICRPMATWRSRRSSMLANTMPLPIRSWWSTRTSGVIVQHPLKQCQRALIHVNRMPQQGQHSSTLQPQVVVDCLERGSSAILSISSGQAKVGFHMLTRKGKACTKHAIKSCYGLNSSAMLRYVIKDQDGSTLGEAGAYLVQAGNPLLLPPEPQLSQVSKQGYKLPVPRGALAQHVLEQGLLLSCHFGCRSPMSVTLKKGHPQVHKVPLYQS